MGRVCGKPAAWLSPALQIAARDIGADGFGSVYFAPDRFAPFRFRPVLIDFDLFRIGLRSDRFGTFAIILEPFLLDGKAHITIGIARRACVKIF